jgi:regulator of protease activity HflC (stomatin/prohibitin superfamily)
MDKEIIIKDTHRGLKYVDGVLTEVLSAGRYRLPRKRIWERLPGRRLWERLFGRSPIVEIELVDMRQRDLTIKGQEILTADKVAIRVSILVQFAVIDPKAAIHKVANYEERLYSDVQLAARRSLATMTLEEILTNRNRLSEDILRDVQGAASGYGVAIGRADVKDIIFPGNLQEIMNKVLAAERNSQAELIAARSQAEIQRLEMETKAQALATQAAAEAQARLRQAEAEAAAIRMRAEAERQALEERSKSAAMYADHPVLVRLQELETLALLSRNANARIYLNFPGPLVPETADSAQ